MKPECRKCWEALEIYKDADGNKVCNCQLYGHVPVKDVEEEGCEGFELEDI